MIACKIENIIMQTPIFSISSEAFKRMVLKGKGAEGRVFLQRPGPVLRQEGDAEKSSAVETRETGSHKDQDQTGMQRMIRQYLIKNIAAKKHGAGMIADPGQQLRFLAGDQPVFKCLDRYGCSHWKTA